MRTVSVNELAEQVRRGPDEDVRIAADRVRSWTREGLLTTVGEKNPGTGKSRQYHRKALVEAALLQALTETMRISVANIRPVFVDVKKHAATVMNDPGGLVVLSRTPDKWVIDSTTRSELSSFVEENPAEAHTIIDLSLLFARVLSTDEA